MADIDNRSLLLPAYSATIDGGRKVGCEINTLANMAHVGHPLDNGWQPGGYGYSRAYSDYFDNHEPKLGASMERSINAAIKWGMTAEKYYPTTKENCVKKPPVIIVNGKPYPTDGKMVIVNCIKDFHIYKGEEYSPKELFDIIDKLLGAGKIIGSYLELSMAIHDIKQDGIMPNKDTPSNYRHVVPMHGRYTKNKNPFYYGFRNDAGTGWGDNGDFYIHKSYLVRHKKALRFFEINFM